VRSDTGGLSWRDLAPTGYADKSKVGGWGGAGALLGGVLGLDESIGGL
jgi:hypothetical protein